MVRATRYSVLLVAGVGCVSAGGASVPSAGSGPTQGRCVLSSGPSIRDTIVVALAQPPDPSHAPVPQSTAERLVFRHLYETLIRVDCEGIVSSELAESWYRSDDGSTWTFRIRAGVSFWDGTPVTAEAIKQSWLEHESSGAAPWADSIERSVSVVGELELRVRLGRPHTDVPPVFADPTLAVALPVEGGARWPMGTGTYQVVATEGTEVIASPLGALGGHDLPVLRFMLPSGDARDLIDRGVDLLVSSDPLVVQYAVSLESLDVLPLPWDLVYVAAAPLRAGGVSADDTLRLSEAVGVGAARIEARLAEPPFWWGDLAMCRLPSSLSAPVDPGGVAGRVAYRSGDAVARALGERLVALASTRRLPQLTDVPERLATLRLDESRFASALAMGRDLAYVLPLPRHVLDPCAELAGLGTRLPWTAPVDLRSVLVPLVETRARAIVRRGIGLVLLDWDGAPYVAAVEGR